MPPCPYAVGDTACEADQTAQTAREKEIKGDSSLPPPTCDIDTTHRRWPGLRHQEMAHQEITMKGSHRIEACGGCVRGPTDHTQSSPVNLVLLRLRSQSDRHHRLSLLAPSVAALIGGGWFGTGGLWRRPRDDGKACLWPHPGTIFALIPVFLPTLFLPALISAQLSSRAVL